MKRDPRLRALSSDHHRALVMARRMAREGTAETPDPRVLGEIEAFCREELAPHFTQEEEILLPALERHGESALVERTLREHAEMMSLAERLNEPDALVAFSRLLKQHVRFEEQELFDVAQAKLDETELERIADRSHPLD